MGGLGRDVDVGGQPVSRKKDASVGYELSGNTSDRIRSGEIKEDALQARRIETFEEMPDIEFVRHGGGRGLGAGAERRRNGGAS